MSGERRPRIPEMPDINPPEPVKPVGWYTRADLARARGVSVQTIDLWRTAGQIPQPSYIGVAARWSKDDYDRIVAFGPEQKGKYPVVPSPRSGVALRSFLARVEAELNSRKPKPKAKSKPTKKAKAKPTKKAKV